MTEEELDIAWRAMLKRAEAADALAPWEVDWLHVGTLTALVNNGGLSSYFYNSGADNFSECIAALERLGAMDVQRLVKGYASLFGDCVPLDCVERNSIMASWDETVDEEIDSIEKEMRSLMPDLESRLDGFVETNIR